MARTLSLSWAIAASVVAHGAVTALLLSLPPRGGEEVTEGEAVEVRLLAPSPVAVAGSSVQPPQPVATPPAAPLPPQPQAPPPPRPRPPLGARPVADTPPATPVAPVAPAETTAATTSQLPGFPPSAAAPSAAAPPAAAPPAGQAVDAAVGGGGSPTPAASGLDAAGDRGEAIAALVRRLKHHRRYPLQARQHQIEGAVCLHFWVAPDGQLARAEIARSSGSPLLDQAARATLDRSFPLDPATARLLTGEPITVDLTFRLVDE